MTNSTRQLPSELTSGFPFVLVYELNGLTPKRAVNEITELAIGENWYNAFKTSDGIAPALASGALARIEVEMSAVQDAFEELIQNYANEKGTSVDVIRYNIYLIPDHACSGGGITKPMPLK